MQLIELIPVGIRRQSAALLHDMLMIPAAWFGAYFLRFNLNELPEDVLYQAIEALAIIIPIQLASFYFFGLYKGIWRFASLPDILRILKSVAFGVTIGLVTLFVYNRADSVPRSVPFLYPILLIMLLSGPRVLYRWLKDHHLHLSSGKRVLIIGSGNAGEMLARDIRRNQTDAYQPVAFVDDNPKKQGRDIHGIPISGKTTDIPELVGKLSIDLIMLAIPSAKSSEIRRIVEICEQTGVPFRSVPHLQDLISGHVTVNELREVSIEDLLGREPVTLDWKSITSTLSGKTILVTGAGGSIGSELCRQISGLNPSKLVLLDNSEFNLYSIEMELSQVYPDLELEHHLGDVTDIPFIKSVFALHQPKIVFHAAAYKHVPMLETQIRQAMRNNVLGTRNVADAASEFNSEIFVLVSTDKAVNPANVMGATKRAAEIYCQNLNAQSYTNYLTVRFGNVLGSAGSVIPLFRKQIQQGGPVTVTDSRMERYFMTIPEASQLIMQTTVLGKGGEIFVLDMGEAVKISYLAEQMIRLSGKIPGEDIQIEYIGLRPGEKLYEELFHEKEQLEGTSHKKVQLAKHRKVPWEELKGFMVAIEQAAQQMDENSLLEILNKMVPEHVEQVSRQKNADDLADNVIPLQK